RVVLDQQHLDGMHQHDLAQPRRPLIAGKNIIAVGQARSGFGVGVPGFDRGLLRLPLESHGQGPAYAGSGLLGVLPVALYGFIQPDTTTVELDDLLAHCQTDTGTGVFFASVQPLEDHEDSFRVLRFDTDSVVDTAADAFVATTFDADVHARRVLTPELHGVADEVEEHLGEQGAVTLDGGQRVVGDHCLDLFQASGQAAERIPQSHVEVDGGEILGPADPGKGQQVVDEGLHTL